MSETRTHDLASPGVTLYNVECRTCGMGALAALLGSAEKLAKAHVGFRGDHVVTISGRGLARMEITRASLTEAALLRREPCEPIEPIGL